MKWYVYTYRNENNCVYYCGKGVGGRCYSPTDHPELPPKERIVLTYFDTEEEAWECERALIQFWGRKGLDANGVLLNRALGGPGSPGVYKSAETRRKIAESRAANPENLVVRALNWIITKPDGSEIPIRNLKKFCDVNDLNHRNLHAVAVGKRNHHKGYKCRYA